MTPNVIGLTGKMGAGKDTVLERLQALYGEANYRKASYAAPLKEAAGALLGLTVEQLEAMKNEPTIRLTIVDLKGAGRDLGRSFSMREYLQRFGTEVGRETFGENFWVDLAMERLQQEWAHGKVRGTAVFTDVRFENEAQAIIDAGGIIIRVQGPDVDTGEHASEAGIPDALVSHVIDNSLRPSFEEMTAEPEVAAEAMATAMQSLDDEVARVHAEVLS